MKRWTIYSKDGQPRYTTHVELDESGEVVWQDTFELHDEWMAECFLTLTIKNPEPIDFCVGDYIDYRGERYSINYDPSVIKKARSGSYSEGFTYDNIKFVSVQDEIVRCDFIDIVLSDNNVHYTSLPVFPFYCETVDDLLDRIQACLEELYPGKWILISPDNVRNRQRGLCVNRASEFISAYNKYIGENTNFKYEKTGVPLTANNITCWDAMKFVHDEFGLNFIVRGRCVIVGTVGVFTSKKFRYGKGNGLYEIERIGDPEQQIVTRLKSYGNETNLPERYYATLNLQVFANVEEIRNVYSYEETPGIDFTLNLDFSSKYFNYRSKSYPSTDSAPNFIVKMEANDHAVIGYITKDSQSNRCYVYCEHTTDGLDDRDEPDREEMAAFAQALKVGDRVYFRAYVEKGAFGEGYHSYSTQNLPDNMEINRLMLPGFPNKSLQQWVQEHSDDERIAAAIAEGFTFSDNKYRPYIDSPNKSIYDIRPANIYFDGSNDTDDIFPTLAGMTYQGTASDAIVSADQITDNGVLSTEAKDSEKRVNVVLPYAGFDLSELWSSDATIEIKDGMCGARSLKIVNKPTRDTNGNWLCACERAYDETLHLYYPYSDFQIKKGDKFVLTGIELPDEYVEAASERLFFASLDALRKNHAPRYTFQPRIDEIWMQRQHDQATSGGVASLHDTLKAGDIFLFADDDLGIDAQIIIDVLTIKENANNGIPTYEITLRDEKVVSAIDKIQNKIVSALGGGGGSGMSSALYSSLVSSEGSGLFLSKVYDDEAQGVIGFLSGAWFGIKTWFIDALGDANLNNVTVNGVLKALYSYINKVQSTNYTGDGIFDTGWRIINDYEGGNSKATFDYLYVRKKFTAEELEIRKITSIGGNFCLSPSSGRIWKIDYFDGEGTLLGYDIYSVPWTLGGRIMTLFKKNPLNRFLAHEKKLQRKLTDEERARVRKIRCYQFCDDGSTQTMSNWTVGAQARCQTFNVKQQMEFDGSSWKGVKVSNTYWWRLVSGVGSMMMEDGSTHDYVDFLVNTGSSATEAIVAEPGSDWPSVGDMMVQVGHRTDPEQMNVIMLETVGEDAPAFKEYRNINSWSLEGKRKTMISPKSGNELYATRFIIETEYGDNIVPVDRGLWVDIVPDADGNRRCYYYDRVAHNGALWLCMVAEGYHYEKDGRWLTQQEVDAMSLEEQKELDRVRNWTGVEPGDATAEQRTVWVKSVYAGIAPYLKFSDALIAIPCEKDGKASEKFTKTVTVKLMVTNLEATITKVEMEGGNSHVKLKNNTIKISYAEGDTITNKDYTITVEGDCQEQHYVATDKISIYAVIRGNDAYEVSATPSSWIWAQEGANLTSQQLIDAMNNGTLPSSYNIMIDGVEEVNGKMGNSAAQISVTNDGVDMPFQIVSVYASDSRVSTEYNNLTGRVWVKSLPNDLESGYIDVNIVYGNAAQKTLRIPFHCNLLGKWRELILGDTQLIIADKTRYIEEEIGSINEELDQARLDFNNATKELSDVIGANKATQEEINEIIADGIIDAKEKATLKALQKSLKAEYNEAISAYQPVHDNEFLKDSSVKTALETAKANVDTAYTNVDNKITQLLDIEVISSEKAAEVNSVFTAFDEKLQAFRTALENAANSITAQIAAESDSKIAQALAEAKSHADAAKAELNDIIEANKTAQETLNGVMADGIIDAEEKATLRSMQKSLLTEYDEAIAAYTPVYENEYLKDPTVKKALKTAKNNVVTAYTNVNNKINELLAIETISREKAAEVNSVFTAFDEKLQAFRTALENATNSITAQIAAESDSKIAQALAEAKSHADAAKAELNDIIEANKTAQETLNGVMADGIIDAEEKATLRSMQKSLLTEYDEAIAAYSPVYENEYLKDSTVKKALKTAKDNVVTAYTNVNNKINELLAIETISREKAAEVNSVFTAFDEKLQAFRTALENATNSITAQIAAESDSKIAQALAEAKSHADAAKAELNDIIEANKTAQETLNGVMADGIIDAEEKATLRSMQKSLLTEYDEAIAAYSPVYENEYLKDSTVKKALKTAKDNVVTAYTNVNNKINELLAINNISRDKAAEVNSVFTAFDEKLQAFRTALENAANSITAQIAAESDSKIAQALAEAKSYANTAIKELDDVVKANKEAQDEVNAAVADGIITAEEKGTLKALQKSLQVTYDEAVAAYAPVYNNPDLTDETIKTNLSNAKSEMDSAYTAVNNALTTLIAKDKITSKEAQSVNSKFNTFDNKLKAYRTALENATNAIIERIKALGNTQYESFHAEYVRSSQENTANFEAIRTSLLNLERADTNLQKNIDDAKSDLQSSINSTKKTLQSSINSVSDELSEAKTNLSKDIGTVSTNLATYKQTADANIEALASRVTNNETSISNQNTRISTAEGNINTISSTLTVHGRDITSINTRVSTAEKNISTISTKVDGKLSKTELYQEATRVGLAVYSSVTTDIANAKSGAITTAGNNADTKISDYNKKVLKTGINVDSQVITFQSDNVRFCSSDGTVRDYVKITSDGKIKATDVDLTGKITATSGSIGSWNINSGNLECDGTPYISAYTNGYRFVAIGGSDGYTGQATIRARNDGGECIHVESYALNGSTGTAISTLANQGGYSIRSWGNTWFTVRSGEEFKILGDSYGFRVSARGGVQVTSNGGTNWYNVTSSEGVNVSWDQITGKPTWIGSSKPSYSWREISGKPTIPTASISGRTITINGTSIEVPEAGSGGSFNGGEITNDLWLHTGKSNYGSTLYFGDRSYVYLQETEDDLLKIHSTRLIIDSKITQEVFFNMYSGTSGGDKPILKFYNDNNWIGYYNCGSGWGTHGMMIKTNDFEVNGGYHISLYTASSSSYFVINKTNISASHSISTGSDIRLKDEVGKLEKRVEEFAEAPLVRFTFKADEDKVIHVGSYAQYWQNILPESVTTTENPVTKQEYLSMSYSEIAFVGMVTNSREIVTLKAAVKARDNKIKTLENEVADMKETIGTQAQQIERILGLLDGLLFNNQNS